MKIKQVINLLARMKNGFAAKQSPALKQAAGLTVQSGLKAGVSTTTVAGSADRKTGPSRH